MSAKLHLGVGKDIFVTTITTAGCVPKLTNKRYERKVKLYVGEDDRVVGGPAGTNNNFWKPFPTLKLNRNHSTC